MSCTTYATKKLWHGGSNRSKHLSNGYHGLLFGINNSPNVQKHHELTHNYILVFDRDILRYLHFSPQCNTHPNFHEVSNNLSLSLNMSSPHTQNPYNPIILMLFTDQPFFSIMVFITSTIYHIFYLCVQWKSSRLQSNLKIGTFSYRML